VRGYVGVTEASGGLSPDGIHPPVSRATRLTAGAVSPVLGNRVDRKRRLVTEDLLRMGLLGLIADSPRHNGYVVASSCLILEQFLDVSFPISAGGNLLGA
jgi:hypothetical protein